MKKLKLVTNMRAKLGADDDESIFPEKLLSLGNGEFPADEYGMIDVSQIGVPCDGYESLAENVYPDIEYKYETLAKDELMGWLKERAILAPTNAAVNDKINSKLLNRLPGIYHFSLIQDFTTNDCILSTIASLIQ